MNHEPVEPGYGGCALMYTDRETLALCAWAEANRDDSLRPLPGADGCPAFTPTPLDPCTPATGEDCAIGWWIYTSEGDIDGYQDGVTMGEALEPTVDDDVTAIPDSHDTYGEGEIPPNCSHCPIDEYGHIYEMLPLPDCADAPLTPVPREHANDHDYFRGISEPQFDHIFTGPPPEGWPCGYLYGCRCGAMSNRPGPEPDCPAAFRDEIARLREQVEAGRRQVNAIAEAMHAYPDSDLVSLATTLSANAEALEKAHEALRPLAHHGDSLADDVPDSELRRVMVSAGYLRRAWEALSGPEPREPDEAPTPAEVLADARGFADGVRARDGQVEALRAEVDRLTAEIARLTAPASEERIGEIASRQQDYHAGLLIGLAVHSIGDIDYLLTDRARLIRERDEARAVSDAVRTWRALVADLHPDDPDFGAKAAAGREALAAVDAALTPKPETPK
jgi:hypothetical protein